MARGPKRSAGRDARTSRHFDTVVFGDSAHADAAALIRASNALENERTAEALPSAFDELEASDHEQQSWLSLTVEAAEVTRTLRKPSLAGTSINVWSIVIVQDGARRGSPSSEAASIAVGFRAVLVPVPADLGESRLSRNTHRGYIVGWSIAER